MVANEGKLEALFTAPYTFVNGPLAAYYGAAGVTGTDLKKVDLNPGQRAGILTQGGFLASHATPEPGLTALIFRGVFVREQLLCEPLPEPPADAAEMSPPVTATTTPRSWSKERMAIAACGACHTQFDPIGYGFEGCERDRPAGGQGRRHQRRDQRHRRGRAVQRPGGAGRASWPAASRPRTAWRPSGSASPTAAWKTARRDACSLNSLRAAFEESGAT